MSQLEAIFSGIKRLKRIQRFFLRKTKSQNPFNLEILLYLLLCRLGFENIKTESDDTGNENSADGAGAA